MVVKPSAKKEIAALYTGLERLLKIDKRTDAQESDLRKLQAKLGLLQEMHGAKPHIEPKPEIFTEAARPIRKALSKMNPIKKKESEKPSTKEAGDE